MTVLPPRVSHSAFDGARLRVLLLVDLQEGTQEEFLHAYGQMNEKVAAVPGHISDQLCQSIENPLQWLITSEWQDAPTFLAWANSDEHLAVVEPMQNCIRTTRSLRYNVLRETHGASDAGRQPAAPAPQVAPRLGEGVVRHALTFTVKPGSEDIVAKILADYDSPAAQVDDTTRLRRTSLFLHGNRVVRAVEVEGDLTAALRHIARQPEIRAVEEAVDPHLEQERDLSDPRSARAFFARAALPMVHHESMTGHAPADLHRHALLYEAAPGCGSRLARLLAAADEAVADDPSNPVAVSTLFQSGDVVVRLVDMAGPLDARPEAVLGIAPGRVAEFARLLRPGHAPAPGQDLAGFLADRAMTPITERFAPQR